MRVQADLAAASAPIVGPGASSDADGMSTSMEGLSDDDVVVVAEGISMGEKVSLYRGRSWWRRGSEGDVGDGWLFLRRCRWSEGLLLLMVSTRLRKKTLRCADHFVTVSASKTSRHCAGSDFGVSLSETVVNVGCA